MPRGSIVKDSSDILCMAIYTGSSTKLAQNMGKYKFKRSILHSRFNNVLKFNFIALLVTIAAFCLCNRFWTHEAYGKHWYI